MELTQGVRHASATALPDRRWTRDFIRGIFFELGFELFLDTGQPGGPVYQAGLRLPMFGEVLGVATVVQSDLERQVAL